VGDSLGGTVPGYIGTRTSTPGTSLTHAVQDARHVRLLSAEGGGTWSTYGKYLGIVVDRTEQSSRDEAHWILCEGTTGTTYRCVKLSVTLVSGIAFVQVNSAFRFYKVAATWTHADDAFDATIAHEMYTKRGSTYSYNALYADHRGHGVHHLKWRIDASIAPTFSPAEKKHTGTMPSYVLKGKGSFVTFLSDVRELKLLTGEPGGRYFTLPNDKCNDMVPDPTREAATKQTSHYIYVSCRAPYVRFVQVMVQLYHGAAYARVTGAYIYTASFNSIDGMDLHQMWRKGRGMSYTDRDTGSGAAVQHVKWELEPSDAFSSISLLDAKGDEPAGRVPGYIGKIAPGASLTDAVQDAREVRIISADFGGGVAFTSLILDVLPDPTISSSRDEAHWLFAVQDGTRTECIKFKVTLSDGMAYLRVTDAFYDNGNQDSKHFAWVLDYAYKTAPVLKGTLFDAMAAHELWVKRDGTYPNSLYAWQSGYGLRNVRWEKNASIVPSFDRADKKQSGTLSGYVQRQPGTPIAFVSDVRKIRLLKAEPGGSYMYATDKCKNVSKP